MSLNKESNLMSFASLRPTKGLNIEHLETKDLDIIACDFGGQESYRIDYLQDFSKNCEGVEKVIFVIDIQDFERYGLALQYLEDIIDRLKKENLHISLSIYLHKYDPNIKSQEKFKDIDNIIIFNLIKIFQKLGPLKIVFDVNRTTIYTTFEKSLRFKE